MPVTTGDYQVVEVLRDDERRTVYRARQARIDREVLLVVEKGEGDVAGLDERCRRVARIFHPGIVPLIDFGILPGGAFYSAMPDPGRSRTLPGWIDEAKGEPWSLPDRLPRLLEDLAAIEDHLESRGWTVEALDPRDVLLHGEGRASILASGLLRPRIGALDPALLDALPAVWRSAIARALHSGAPAAPPGLAGSLHERYELLVTLGKGAFGHVVLARQLDLGRRVAIKFLTQALDADQCSAVARFMQEARTLARLQHPHLVRVFDLGVEAGVAFIVFEYLEGETLARRLARDAPVSALQAMSWLDGILAGLGALHEARILHRDIKPSNLMLTSDGLKIIDLGIALVADQIERLTMEGELMGTPAFCAPEQLLGRTVDESTDLHACGAVTYLALTGRQAFPGPFSEVVTRKLNGDPDPILESDGVPPAVGALVTRLLERDPQKRYRNVTEVRRDLETVLDALRPPPTPGLAPVAPPPRRVTRRTANRPAAATSSPARRLPGSALVGATLIALSSMWFSLRETPTPPAKTVPTGVSSVPASTPRRPDARLRSQEGKLELQLDSPSPMSCRAVGRQVDGKPWVSPWSTRATAHRFPLPAIPLQPPVDLEVDLGADTERTPLSFSSADQELLWERIVTWFETEVTKPVADELAELDLNSLAIYRWMGGAGSEDEKAQVKRVTEAIRLFLTLGSLGGPHGLLARPEVSLSLKARFYAALEPMETASAVLGAFTTVTRGQPVMTMTAPGYGPMTSLPPAGVSRTVLELDFVNQNEVFEILPDCDPVEALPDLDRRPAWTHGILATVELEEVPAGHVAVLFADGWTVSGTHLAVRINDRHHLRMQSTSPGQDVRAPIGVRFPAAMLHGGTNRFYFHVPALPLFADASRRVGGMRLVPPGISLCFEPS